MVPGTGELVVLLTASLKDFHTNTPTKVYLKTVGNKIDFSARPNQLSIRSISEFVKEGTDYCFELAAACDTERGGGREEGRERWGGRQTETVAKRNREKNREKITTTKNRERKRGNGGGWGEVGEGGQLDVSS